MLNSSLEWRFAIVYEGLLGDLEACNSQVALMEWLNRVELIAVLCSHLISVQVFLSLPSSAVKEIHGCVETTGCNCCLPGLRWFH